ncbi:MAG: hypothetical protein ACP5LG_08280, partial [Conexivisphaera sp.]
MAGVALYTHSTTQNTATVQQVNIRSASLTVPNGAGSTGYLTITLQNPGTVAVSSVDLVMFDGVPVTGGTGWIGAIPPGGTTFGSAAVMVSSGATTPSATYDSCTHTLTLSTANQNAQLVAGQSYPIQLVVNYANGQNQTITTTITASAVGTTQNTAISIQSAYISGENGVMTITIQNTGSASINSLIVRVYQQHGENMS